MKRKDGLPRKDYQRELDDVILDTIDEKKYTNAEHLRQIINKRYCRKLGWATIQRHLKNLMEQKRIEIYYQTEGDRKRTVRVYRILVK